jgi:hypothetical protein
MEASSQFDAPAALNTGREVRHSLDRRLGANQIWSGRGGEEKNSFPVPTGNRTPVIQPIGESTD